MSVTKNRKSNFSADFLFDSKVQYVLSSHTIDLYGIAHVKVDFIPLQKMYVIPILGRFV